MKKLLIIFSLFLFSCGAKKTQSRSQIDEVKTESKEIVKNNLEITSNTKIETKVFTDEKTGEEIEESTFTPIDNTKPAIHGKDTITNGSLTKRKIKRNKTLSETKNANTSNDIKNVDKGTKERQKKEQTKAVKKESESERKQFDIVKQILSYWWILAVIIALRFIYKKYKDKIWWV